MKVSSLMELIEQVTGLSKESMGLSVDGVALSGTSTLAEAGLISGSTLLLADEGAAMGGGASPIDFVVLGVPWPLQATYGTTVGIAASASTKVSDLRATAASVLGVPAGSLNFEYDGFYPASGATLGGMSVRNGGSLSTTFSGTSPANPYTVKVVLPASLQPIHGTSLTLSASPSATASELKAIIEDVTGMGAASMSMRLNGAQLSSGSSLADLGFTSGGAMLLSDARSASAAMAPPIGYVVFDVPSALQSTYGPKISLAATASTTIRELKDMLSGSLGVWEENLNLDMGGSAISSDSATLGSLGLFNGASLGSSLSGPAPSTPYAITVTLPAALQATHGTTLTISASKSTRVSSLKALLERDTGMSTSSMGVRFGGVELSDDSQLMHAGLASGSTLQMVEKYKATSGGGAGIDYVVITVPSALQATYGSTISLAASASTTVDELKAAMASALSLSASDLSFSNGGSTGSSLSGSATLNQAGERWFALNEGSATLGSAGVANGGAIGAAYSGVVPSNPLAITLVLPEALRADFGYTLTLSSSPTATVSSLTTLVEKVTGIGAASIGLSFNGVELTGSTTLAAAGVASGATVLLKDTSAPTGGGTTSGDHIVLSVPEALQPTYGTKMSLGASATTTVDNLRTLAAKALGVGVGALTFRYWSLATGAVPLEDMSSTLGSYMVPTDGAMVGVVFSDPMAPADPFTVSVVMPEVLQSDFGYMMTLASSSTATVADLKGLFQEVTGKSAASMLVSFGGVALTDYSMISDVGITSGSTLLLQDKSTATSGAAASSASAGINFVSLTVPSALQATYGPTISLAASASTTVNELKYTAAGALGVSASALSFSGSTGMGLSGSATLGAAGVTNGGSIGATLFGAAPLSPFTITMVLPEELQADFGTTLTLASSSTATVTDLKALFEEVTGMSTARVGLSFGGATLSGTSTLANAGLISGSTLLAKDKNAATGGGVGIGYVVLTVPSELQGTFGPTISLAASSSTTVGTLSNTAAKALGVAGVKGALSLSVDNGVYVLTDGSASLGSVGLTNGGAIGSALSTSPPMNPYTITVTLPEALQEMYGTALTLATTPTATVGSLKALIQEVTGLSSTSIGMSFGGAELSNGATLAASGLRSGTVVPAADRTMTASSGAAASGSIKHIAVNVPPTLQATYGSTITLAATASTTIGTVGELAERVLGVPMGAIQALHLDTGDSTTGISLWKTLGSVGMVNGGTLSATYGGTGYSSPFSIKIALPEVLQASFGPTITLAASSFTTVSSLKAFVEQVTGMGAESMGLSFGGAALSETSTLASAGLSSGSTLLAKNKNAATGGSGIDYVVLTVPTGLRPTYGPTISLAATASTKASELKATAAAAFGVSPSALSLSNGGSPFDGSVTLGSLGVANGGALGATFYGMVPSDPYTVTVALPTELQPTHGASLTLSSSEATTVAELTSLIEQVTGMTAESMELSFGGDELSGDSALSAAGLDPGSTLLLANKYEATSGGGTGIDFVVLIVPSALQATYGTTMSLAATTSMKVGELKAGAASVLGLWASGATALTLERRGSSIETDLTASLGSLGVPNGGTIGATLNGAAPENPFIIEASTKWLPALLKERHGDTLKVAPPADAKISQLKMLLELVTGMPASAISVYASGPASSRRRLRAAGSNAEGSKVLGATHRKLQGFGGTELDSDTSLVDAGLEPGSSIVMSDNRLPPVDDSAFAPVPDSSVATNFAPPSPPPPPVPETDEVVPLPEEEEAPPNIEGEALTNDEEADFPDWAIYLIIILVLLLCACCILWWVCCIMLPARRRKESGVVEVVIDNKSFEEEKPKSGRFQVRRAAKDKAATDLETEGARSNVPEVAEEANQPTFSSVYLDNPEPVDRDVVPLRHGDSGFVRRELLQTEDLEDQTENAEGASQTMKRI